MHPVDLLAQYSQVKTTSLAVKGVPSDHNTSSRRVQVIEVKSAATPPLSTVGISVAKVGTRVPTGAKRASGSRTMELANRLATAEPQEFQSRRHHHRSLCWSRSPLRRWG